MSLQNIPNAVTHLEILYCIEPELKNKNFVLVSKEPYKTILKNESGSLVIESKKIMESDCYYFTHQINSIEVPCNTEALIHSTLSKAISLL